MSKLPPTEIFKLPYGKNQANLAKVFIINGLPRAGKDTLIGFLSEIFQERGHICTEFSSIDPVRSVLTELGIDTSAKTPADRKLLATIGDAVEEHSQFRSNACIFQVEEAELAAREQKNTAAPILFLHIREPHIIERVVSQIKASGRQAWRVQLVSNRSEAPTNATDAGAASSPYDYMVFNNGTRGELYREANAFVNLISSRLKLSKDFGKPVQAVGLETRHV